ncbi:hypothetical protein EV191_1011350 [Tamaricihabitans halophyticus]|uniref:Secreted protein n=1 Tax=Tamaricihabitans halophyticus TaxID=1262583 RepID=A0A4R2RDA9_9PSEU|nr:hypothetical protein [Tamaricihabitans halophyticus]TCP57395.1 hypothetical protein EV191_1011350 [Tamaricihabitans halophyticus]
MRKFASRAVAAIAITAGIIGFGAGTASAEPVSDNPSIGELKNSWDQGGAMVGGGAAQMVSSAWLGVPLSAIWLGHEAVGATADVAPVQ